MAIVKYGSIVTKIKGSVGGHTFRSIGGVNMLYTKDLNRAGHGRSNGGNVPFLNNLSNKWNSLSTADREEWRNASAFYDRTDRFGNKVPFEGRELFFSWISVRERFNRTSLLPAVYSDIVNTGDVVNVNMRNFNVLEVGFANMTGRCFVIFSMAQYSKGAKGAPFKRYVNLASRVVTSDTNINIGLAFWPGHQFIKSGNLYTLFCTFCAERGIRGPVVSVNIVAP